MAAMTPRLRFPLEGTLPRDHSYTIAPKVKMSLRASASRPSTCSGAMYCSVPRIVPCAVIGVTPVGAMDRPGCRDHRWRHLRETEVEQLRARLRSTYDVARFQVAMHDAGAMRFVECVGDRIAIASV